jgi:hypothetical protein
MLFAKLIHIDGFPSNSQRLSQDTHQTTTTTTMNRVDAHAKRRNVLDHRKKQFADPQYKDTEYPHRLNFYSTPPTADITLEQFEQWAIDRLRGAYRQQQTPSQPNACPRN